MVSKSAVIGIDMGTSNSVIAYVGKGIVDIVQNEVSQRATPTLVGFKGQERLLGDAAMATIKSNLKNSVRNFKHLLGRKMDDPDLESDLANALAATVPSDRGTVAFEVSLDGQDRQFTAEQITAMFLTKLRDTTEAWTKAKVADVVVAVPSYYSDVHRQAVLDACEIAGVKCLRLMNETTATALAYGIYRTNDFDAETPTNVLFASCGYSHMSATVVRFVRNKLEVVADVVERHLGGRDMDKALVDHFAAGFAKKVGCDVRKNLKARYKLEEAVEKTKKTLSANYEAPVHVDCLAEDEDLNAVITRDDFEAACKPLEDRMLAALQKAIQQSGLAMEDIHFVELVGGASRVPFFQRAVTTATNKELSRTINADESVARGAALQAAMLSPLYKVREFTVVDFTQHPVDIAWQGTDAATEEDGDAVMASTGAGNMKQAELFPAKSHMNVLKVLSFNRKDTFDIAALYHDTTTLLPGTAQAIGKYRVNLPQLAEPKEVKVKVKLSLSGTLAVEGAEMVTKEEYEETVKEKRPKEAKAADESPAAAPPAEGAPAEGAAPAADEGAAKEEKPKEEDFEYVDVVKKKTRTKRTELKVEALEAPGMAQQAVYQAADEEVAMQAAQREIRETFERRNDLETYIFAMRSALAPGGDLHEFTDPAVAEKFVAGLTKEEDWLNDNWEGTKVQFEEKLAELQETTRGPETRKREAQAAPEVVARLQDTIAEWRMRATSPDEAVAHIDAAKKQSIVAKCDEFEAWLQQQQAAQNALPNNVDRVLTCHMVESKVHELLKFAQPIMAEPKPKPAKKEEPAPPADAPGPQANDQQAEQPAGDAPAADGQEAPPSADLD